MSLLTRIVDNQKKRLTNVKDVLTIATAKAVNFSTFGIVPSVSDKLFGTTIKETSRQNITANVSNPTTKAGLEFVANNPGTTALLATGAVKVAQNLPAIGKAIAGTSTKTKVVGGALALTVVPTIAEVATRSPETVIKTASSLTGESIVDYFQRLSGVSSLEDTKNLAKSNPLLTGALAGGAILLAGKATAGIANTIATAQNTSTLRNVYPVSIDKEIITSSPYVPDTSGDPATGATSTPQLPTPSDAPVVPIGKATTKKKAKKKRKSYPLTTQKPVNVRINNIVAGRFIY